MISIIIPCKDHIKELRSCLEVVQRFQENILALEVIVVNSANDPQVSAVLAEFPTVKEVETKRMLNPGASRNAGSKKASGDILAFLDADCIPLSDWAEKISKAFQEDIVMIGGSVSTVNFWNLLAVSDNLIHFYQFSPWRPAGRTKTSAGCNLSIRKEIFMETGGFPETRVAEDWSLSQKISTEWPSRSLFIPEIEVAHIGRSKFKTYFNHQYFHGYERGLLGHEISPTQQQQGQYLGVVPFVMGKRLSFIYSQVFRWRKWRSILYLSLLPTVLYGLFAWALGFRKGCRQACEN